MPQTLPPFTSPVEQAHLPPPPPPLTDEHSRLVELLISRFSQPEFVLPCDRPTYRAIWKGSSKWRESGKLDEGEKEKYLVPATDSKKSSGWFKSSSTPAPAAPNAGALFALLPIERMSLTRDQFCRVCRSVKWDKEKAINRAEETIVWKREYGVVKIGETAKKGDEEGSWDEGEDWLDETVEIESESGKMYLLGFDINSRPCLLMHPYRQNTDSSPRQIQFLVQQLERAIDLMPPGCESMSICIDFGSKKGAKGQPTSIQNSMLTIEFLQNYYVERLGKAICINVPWFFNGFWKVVSPFIDPITKEKINFNPDVPSLVPPEQLEQDCFGGDLDFEYSHQVFWPELISICSARRKERYERWKTSGSKIGEEEWIIKGGDLEEINRRVNHGTASEVEKANGEPGQA